MRQIHMKNTLIKALVTLLQIKPAARDNIKKFLILSTTGLGDTLWATPAIKALRETYPDCYIGVLTSPMGKQVLLHNPHINELFIVNNPALPSLFSHFKTMRQKEFTHVFAFHTSQRPVLPFAAMLGAHTLVGTQGINKGLDSLFTHCLKLPKMHEIQRRLKIVETVQASTSNPELELFFNEQDEQITTSYLASLSLPSYVPMIAFHPGAKDSFKQWPTAHFISLGNRLVDHLGCQIFITGTPEEKTLVEEIAAHIKGAVPVTHLPLRSLAVLLKKMSLMVTNDTGPMHVAFAMKTPTVALFAPTDPQLCGPYAAQKVKVIAKPRTCTPCRTKKCQSPFCLLQIGVREVYDAALTLFYEGRGETPTQHTWAHFHSGP